MMRSTISSRRSVLALLLAASILTGAGPAASAASAEGAEGAEGAEPGATDTGAADAAGPAAPQEPAPESEASEVPSIEERLDALLAETLPEGEYREVRRCIRRHEYRQVEVLDDRYVLFRKSGRNWLNQLKQPCPGLARRELVMSFDSRGTSSLCDGERMYLTSRYDLDRGFDSSGRPLAAQGICTLGSFEVISAEQAAALRGVRE